MATDKKTTRQALEQANNNIDRIRILRREENENAATELIRETEELIPQLSTTGKRTVRKALTEVTAEEVAPEASHEVSTIDYRAVIKDADAVVGTASKSLHETIVAQDRSVDQARVLAEHMFQQYAQFTHNGSPDLKANSQAARDIAADTQRQVRETLVSSGLDEDQAKAKVAAAWGVMKRRLSDVRADYANSMDDTPEEFQRQYPLIAEKYPDMRPAEALSYAYEIDLLGYSKRASLKLRLKSRREKLEITQDEKERTRLQAEVAELEQTLGAQQSPTVDPAKVTRQATKQIGAASAALDPQAARRLPAKDKRVIAETYPAIIGRMSAVLQAVTEIPED